MPVQRPLIFRQMCVLRVKELPQHEPGRFDVELAQGAESAQDLSRSVSERTRAQQLSFYLTQQIQHLCPMFLFEVRPHRAPLRLFVQRTAHYLAGVRMSEGKGMDSIAEVCTSPFL